jgi:ribose transport system substrate-binding protein
MMQNFICARRGRLGVLATIAVAILVAACGGESTTSSGSNSPTTGGNPGRGVNVAAAKALIAPYVGHPSTFPTDQPLKQLPPAGSEVAYIDAGTVTAALQWSLLEQAAKTMGVTPVRVAAGSTASTVSAAMDSVVSKKPAGVVIVGLDPEEYAPQLKELRADGIPVVASAIEDGGKYDVSGPVSYGPSNVALAGRLMAAWAIARTGGKVKQFVLYNVPELSFSPVEVDAARTELAELCSTCTARVVDIPAAEIGNGASNTIVSDLQGHPGTGFAILATDELADGLPQALNTAGLNVQTVGPAPGPQNLEQIKQGSEDGALGVDLEEQMWALLDQWARERSGQPLDGPEAKGELVMQFLTQKDITFNPADGWAGYQDLPARFAKLWGK